MMNYAFILLAVWRFQRNVVYLQIKQLKMKWSYREVIVSCVILLVFSGSIILMKLGYLDKMTTVVFLFIISICMLADYYWKLYRAKKMGLKYVTGEIIETRKLVKETLKKMNCQVEETKDGRFSFDYQGVRFLIEAADGCMYINLIWPWCYSVPLYDADEYSRLRKVVNELNERSLCTVFYIPNNELDEVGVHLKKHILFVSEIAPLDDYLHSTLNAFFVSVQQLNLEMEKVRLKEQEMES